jgi:hypothetical protein
MVSKSYLIHILNKCLNTEEINSIIIETNKEIENYKFLGMEEISKNIYKLDI